MAMKVIFDDMPGDEQQLPGILFATWISKHDLQQYRIFDAYGIARTQVLARLYVQLFRN